MNFRIGADHLRIPELEDPNSTSGISLPEIAGAGISDNVRWTEFGGEVEGSDPKRSESCTSENENDDANRWIFRDAADRMTAAELLEYAYRLDAASCCRRSIALILNAVDDWLNDGRRERCLELLKQADVDRLSLQTLIAILGITLPIQADNPVRDRFFDAVRRKVAEVRTEVQTCELLEKYR